MPDQDLSVEGSTTRGGNSPEDSPHDRRRITVIGSGWRFTSGISYYTCRLTNELSASHDVSAILMRRLVPRSLYPGRSRVGRKVNRLEYGSDVQVFDGVDWYWGRSMSHALREMSAARPDVVVLEWWTGAVLHSYLRLASRARRLGAIVIMEFHEVQDTGESRLPLAATYVRHTMPRLLRLTDALLLHSEFDRRALAQAFGDLGTRPVEIVPHGPYDFVAPETGDAPRRPDGVVRLLFFGTIRPYKGLEDLVDAFDAMTDEEAERYELRVVGETWEGWHLPLEKIDASPRRDRIRVTNRYVTDDEVQQAFAQADVVVLPYRRSSSSGPLHIAMAAGLPIVVTDVGGLAEAAAGYEGADMVAPGDPEALRAAIHRAAGRAGRRFADPRDWAHTASAIGRLAASVRQHRAPASRPATGGVPALAVQPRRDGAAAGYRPSVSVVVACFCEQRWDLLLKAIDSVRRQDYPHELIVSVDHNEHLYQRLVALELPDVRIVRNAGSKGASGARNTGALTAGTDYVAFLDDDAYAEPGWLAALVEAVESTGAIGGGGRIDAAWHTAAPRWFPPEFGWVVGASPPLFPELPELPEVVRNVWAGSMLVRQPIFASVGGFREDFGKLGPAAEPEDTELCLRLAADSQGQWVFVSASVVKHHVPAERATLSYFVRRCWMEGRGKAALWRSSSSLRRTSLTSEGDYLRRTLPSAVARELRSAARGHGAAALRALAIVLGALCTLTAFVASMAHRPARPTVPGAPGPTAAPAEAAPHVITRSDEAVEEHR